MAFDLGKFFEDIFKPQKGEIVTVMHDLAHGDIEDNDLWKERRKMAADWRDNLAELADKWGITVNPLATYNATGGNNAGLPETLWMGGEERQLADVVVEEVEALAVLLGPQGVGLARLFEAHLDELGGALHDGVLALHRHREGHDAVDDLEADGLELLVAGHLEPAAALLADIDNGALEAHALAGVGVGIAEQFGEGRALRERDAVAVGRALQLNRRRSTSGGRRGRRVGGRGIGSW